MVLGDRQIDKSTNRQIDKSTNRKNKNKSFTLVEVVFTISIIGILMAIIMPAVSSAKLGTQKVRDISNLKKITEAWREAVINRGWRISGRYNPNGDGNTYYGITAFAEELAGRDQVGNISNIILNDPYIYISPGDKYASRIVSESLARVENSKIGFTTAFSGTKNFMATTPGTRSWRTSYCFVLNLPAVPLDTTPFGFTRGLREDGKWDEKVGLYGSKGGYVVYCDGHTVWFDGSSPAKFLHWNQKEYTTDIRKAVPDSAWISCGSERTVTDYKSDGQLVILCHAGTGGAE
ncbi:MAG: type II secretion system GspH family protein [Puniceicoccales bacterium]|jgi:Tfp pilus assembly protein FimT|nr:type II secretion system GspH family protein [Puniceicoccales bacterium]